MAQNRQSIEEKRTDVGTQVKKVTSKRLKAACRTEGAALKAFVAIQLLKHKELEPIAKKWLADKRGIEARKLHKEARRRKRALPKKPSGKRRASHSN